MAKKDIVYAVLGTALLTCSILGMRGMMHWSNDIQRDTPHINEYWSISKEMDRLQSQTTYFHRGSPQKNEQVVRRYAELATRRAELAHSQEIIGACNKLEQCLGGMAGFSCTMVGGAMMASQGITNIGIPIVAGWYHRRKKKG